MIVLVINAGSSSLKASLHEVQSASAEWDGSAPPAPMWDAHVEWSPPPSASTVRITARVDRRGKQRETEHATRREIVCNAILASPVADMAGLLASMWSGEDAVISGPDVVDAIGHRIVYAGPEHRASECLTPGVRAAIASAAEHAPAHAAVALAAVDAALDVFGATVPQVAAFDTAFHKTLAPAVYAYAIPYRWLEQGIRRYGFRSEPSVCIAAGGAHARQKARIISRRDMPSGEWLLAGCGQRRPFS